MSETYLVTGGAGFIGSNLVGELVARGHTVRVLDDLSSGNDANLASYAGDIDFQRGSILDEATLERATAGVDYVIHLAAQVSVPLSMEDPAGTHAVNATGTLRVLEAARRHGVRRVVQAASCAVYGDDPALPKRESMPVAPVSPYAATKHVVEVYGRCYTYGMGLEVASMRYFNVFGPRQDPSGGYAAVIPAFISRILAGKPLTIFGDGEQTRDFVFVENVVEATLLACEAPGAAGASINVGTGVETSLNDLVGALAASTGAELDVRFEAPRAGDVLRSVADIGLARELLGYEPRHGLEAGLARTLRWYEGA